MYKKLNVGKLLDHARSSKFNFCGRSRESLEQVITNVKRLNNKDLMNSLKVSMQQAGLKL